MLGDESGDEGHAVSVAMRTVSGDHIQKLLAAGRERARVLAERPDFADLHERITDALLANGSLDAEDIELIKENSNGNQET